MTLGSRIQTKLRGPPDLLEVSRPEQVSSLKSLTVPQTHVVFLDLPSSPTSPIAQRGFGFDGAQRPDQRSRKTRTRFAYRAAKLSAQLQGSSRRSTQHARGRARLQPLRDAVRCLGGCLHSKTSAPERKLVVGRGLQARNGNPSENVSACVYVSRLVLHPPPPPPPIPNTNASPVLCCSTIHDQARPSELNLDELPNLGA
ncbi:hypothetical protein VDGL01_05216 [Verticillium dahliae]